jgi:drug/metabolite transporter (DMT)-like permease
LDHARLYALILAIVVVTVFADYLLKLASQRNDWVSSLEFGAGALLYGATAVGWVVAMKHASLASIAVSYSVLMLLLVAGLGVIVFRESLSLRDVLGLGLACAALTLMEKA